MSDSKVFSTGPLENANNVETKAVESLVKILNNDDDDETVVTIRVFSLNGTKRLIGERQVTVSPLSSAFPIFDVSNTLQYEVQVKIEEETDDVLISHFGRNANGNLVAAHRVLHTEFAEIDELTDIC